MCQCRNPQDFEFNDKKKPATRKGSCFCPKCKKVRNGQGYKIGSVPIENKGFCYFKCAECHHSFLAFLVHKHEFIAVALQKTEAVFSFFCASCFESVQAESKKTAKIKTYQEVLERISAA